MTRTKTVKVRFGDLTFIREVELGVIATDAYFVEHARERVEREHDYLPPFSTGRVTEEVHDDA